MILPPNTLRVVPALPILLVASCHSTGGRAATLFGSSGGVPWSIRCMEIQGPDAPVIAQQVADSLRQTPGIRPEEVSVLDESDGYWRVYYGTYFRRDEASALPRKLREDLNLLRELGDAAGQRYFIRALPVRKPQADVGRPEWNLAHVDAVYSLQVAAFEPTAKFWEFKNAAAEYCAFLRSRGYEAYFHHGVSTSVVTVGRFGKDAVVRDAAGRTLYSSEVQRLQDDELLKYNLVNGGVVKVKTATGARVPVPSRLVEVPRVPRRGMD